MFRRLAVRNSLLRWSAFTLVAAGITAFATGCGGGGTPTNTPVPPTNTPPPTAVATATNTPAPSASSQSPTATSASAPTATATAIPTSVSPNPQPTVVPSGSIVVATTDVGIPIGGPPAICPAGCGNEEYFDSWVETLLRVDKSKGLTGQVASSWAISPDGKTLTFHIRPGIHFHELVNGAEKDWGELTAQDVAWSYNNANGATNPKSIQDNAGDYAAYIGEGKVVDKYTVSFPITHTDVREPEWVFSPFWQGLGIYSKAVFDQYGNDMQSHYVGSGPYMVDQWVKDNYLLLQAVPNHWRKTPAVKTVRMEYVIEPQNRVSMFKTGEADITTVQLKDQSDLVNNYHAVAQLMGSAEIGLGFSGNYFEKVGARTGNTLSQPGFNPQLPWVSNPNGSGCDWNVLTESVPANTPCPAMEKPREVRKALGMCMDRAGIAKTLYAGEAQPAYVRPLLDSSQYFKSQWILPYDCAAAKQLLQGAGHGNGFSATIYVGNNPTNQELGSAIGGLWQSELGVKTTFDEVTYATIRPHYVDRSNDELILDSGDGTTNWPLDWPQGGEENSWFEGGTMKWGSIPFSAITYGEMASQQDKQKRLQEAQLYWAHEAYWYWNVGVVNVPSYRIYNGAKLNWNVQSTTSWPYGGGDVYPLEDLTWK